MKRFRSTFDWIIFLIVTVGGLGKIRYAPGTFGSLAAYPLWYLQVIFAAFIAVFSTEASNDFSAFAKIYLIASSISFVLIFIAGYVCCKFYLRTTNNVDPQEVVIDELVGQQLTLTSCSLSFSFFSGSSSMHLSKEFMYMVYLVLPFALFRFFDIYKPWPVGWIDKNVKGALGVMLDDIAAATLAWLMHSSLIFILIDYLNYSSNR